MNHPMGPIADLSVELSQCYEKSQLWQRQATRAISEQDRARAAIARHLGADPLLPLDRLVALLIEHDKHQGDA